MIRAILATSLIALGACSNLGTPETVRIAGAETRGTNDRPNVVPAGFVRTAEGTRMELVSADGTVLTGTLLPEERPVVVPLAATGAPLVGGGTDLVGRIEAQGGATLDCRFRLLNPARGVDGGGTGTCTGGDRNVEFRF